MLKSDINKSPLSYQPTASKLSNI